jgi:hypothetical protein
MSVTITYDSSLARIRISATAAGGTAYAVVDRSSNGIRWTVIRGAGHLIPASGALTADDYEFPPGTPVTYRVRAYSAADVLLATETAAATAAIDRPWLKSVSRPFLNRPMAVQGRTPAVSRKARAGVFEIKGRSLPVVVSEVRGPREWTLQVRTDTPADTRGLELLLASGDVLYVQVPPGYDLPGGYVTVGAVTQQRISALPGDLRSVWMLPMTEVAAPGPDVVGYTATWSSLLAEFGSWTAVTAAFGTWAEVAEFVADPETVIVP